MESVVASPALSIVSSSLHSSPLPCRSRCMPRLCLVSKPGRCLSIPCASLSTLETSWNGCGWCSSGGERDKVWWVVLRNWVARIRLVDVVAPSAFGVAAGVVAVRRRVWVVFPLSSVVFAFVIVCAALCRGQLTPVEGVRAENSISSIGEFRSVCKNGLSDIVQRIALQIRGLHLCVDSLVGVIRDYGLHGKSVEDKVQAQGGDMDSLALKNFTKSVKLPQDGRIIYEGQLPSQNLSSIDNGASVTVSAYSGQAKIGLILLDIANSISQLEDAIATENSSFTTDRRIVDNLRDTLQSLKALQSTVSSTNGTQNFLLSNSEHIPWDEKLKPVSIDAKLDRAHHGSDSVSRVVDPSTEGGMKGTLGENEDFLDNECLKHLQLTSDTCTLSESYGEYRAVEVELKAGLSRTCSSRLKKGLAESLSGPSYPENGNAYKSCSGNDKGNTTSVLLCSTNLSQVRQTSNFNVIDSSRSAPKQSYLQTPCYSPKVISYENLDDNLAIKLVETNRTKKDHDLSDKSRGNSISSSSCCPYELNALSHDSRSESRSSNLLDNDTGINAGPSENLQSRTLVGGHEDGFEQGSVLPGLKKSPTAKFIKPKIEDLSMFGHISKDSVPDKERVLGYIGKDSVPEKEQVPFVASSKTHSGGEGHSWTGEVQPDGDSHSDKGERVVFVAWGEKGLQAEDNQGRIPSGNIGLGVVGGQSNARHDEGSDNAWLKYEFQKPKPKQSNSRDEGHVKGASESARKGNAKANERFFRTDKQRDSNVLSVRDEQEGAALEDKRNSIEGRQSSHDTQMRVSPFGGAFSQQEQSTTMYERILDQYGLLNIRGSVSLSNLEEQPDITTQNLPHSRRQLMRNAKEEFQRLMDEGEALLYKGKEGFTGKVEVGVAESMFYEAADRFALAADTDPHSVEALGCWGNTLLMHGELKLKLSRELWTMLSTTDTPWTYSSIHKGNTKEEWIKKYKEQDAVEHTFQAVCEECEELLVEAGRKYRMTLSIDRTDTRALHNWGLALCFRAQLITDEGGEAAVLDADKVYLAAIDKFEAMLGISQAYAQDALLQWGLALQYRSHLRPLGSKERVKLLQQAKQLIEDSLRFDPNYRQAKKAIVALTVELKSCSNLRKRS